MKIKPYKVNANTRASSSETNNKYSINNVNQFVFTHGLESEISYTISSEEN